MYHTHGLQPIVNKAVVTPPKYFKNISSHKTHSPQKHNIPTKLLTNIRNLAFH